MPGLESLKGGTISKGEPKEKSDSQKSLCSPKSAYGFASQILLLHMATTQLSIPPWCSSYECQMER